MSETERKPRIGYDKEYWGEWFDKHILNDWRFEGESFYTAVMEADRKHGTHYGAKVILATFEFATGYNGRRFSLMDDFMLQELFDGLSHTRQRDCCWRFVQDWTDEAREMFYEALDITEPENEDEEIEEAQ